MPTDLTIASDSASGEAKRGTMEVAPACNVCRSESIQKLDAAFNFCRCRACGYVFDSPRPSDEEVAAFYSQPAKYDSWLKEERSRDALWRRRLKKLLPHRVKGNLLDIGAGTGQFLHHARPYFTQVAGTEVSESAARIAREKYGLDLMAGQAEKLDLKSGTFANITLFHVLEHVPDPARLVGHCREWLQPQGMLAIAVPNDVQAWSSKIKKMGKRLGLGPFQKFSPVLGVSRAGTSREIHLSHFTPAVLRRLVMNAGLTMEEESLDPYYVASGAELLAHRTYYGLHRTLQAALKTNYYDTIWMIVRKP